MPMVQELNDLALICRPFADRNRALVGVITRIRESLDLTTILQTTVAEVRQILEVDRVAIVRLAEGRQDPGDIVAEAVIAPWASLCQPTETVQAAVRQWYQQLSQDAEKAHIQVAESFESSRYSDFYRALFKQLQVQSAVHIPLLKGQNSWGWLVVHHCTQTHSWQGVDIEFLDQIAQHLGVAIQHNAYLEHLKKQRTQLAHILKQKRTAERQRTLANTIHKIRQSLDIDVIFQTTTQETRQLLQVDRVLVYQFDQHWGGKFVAESVGRDWSSVLPTSNDSPRPIVLPIPEDCRDSLFQDHKTWCVDDLYNIFPNRHLTNPPGDSRQDGDLEANPAANPAPDLHQHSPQDFPQPAHPDPGRLDSGRLDSGHKNAQASPPASLPINLQEKLRQTLQGQQWGALEAKLQDQLQDQRQDPLQHPLDQTLQDKVQELDQEPGQPQGDRVADAAQQGAQARRLQQDQVLWGWIRTLEGRAGAIAPIFQMDRLWGLLIACQHTLPRSWQRLDADFLSQITAQLGIALQQAELLEQTRRQTAEITQAFQQLQQTQMHLIQSEKMASLGQLVAGIAHEINDPVNFIYGNLSYVSTYTLDLLDLLQLYHQELPNPSPALQERLDEVELDFILEDLPKTLVSMKAGADRIRELVNSLQTFSRLDRSAKHRVDLHEGLESTLAVLNHRLKPVFDRPQIRIIRDYQELPPLDCYAAQLNQVFLNLINNGIDALEDAIDQGRFQNNNDTDSASPTLRLTTRYHRPSPDEQAQGHEAHILIAVADNGVGIAATIQPYIFNPFYTTKAPGRGTGLGLSISYQIVVERHHGELTCQSRSGHGTEFQIKLPVPASPAAEAATNPYH
ncbi:MAG: GAF domain-containing sensor histidine kinase [Prochlorothrix sp.]